MVKSLRSTLLAATAVAALATASSAMAAEAQQQAPYVSLSFGEFDVHQDDTNAALFGLEYRGAPFWYGLLPVFGVAGTDDGSYYGYAGVNYDWNFAGSFYLTPGFAVTAYEDGNDGKNLGGVLEFRSSIEASYRFENEHRLGVAYQHLSNAGIYDRNPGAENLLVTYSVPFSAFK